MVFPFDLVRVSMRGVEESRAAVFRSGFFRSYLEHEIQGSLRADAVRFPGAPARGGGCRDRPAAARRAVADGGRGIAGAAGRIAAEAARLVVRKGSANVPELPLDKARVYIGREVDVYRNGGLFRRNDLAFVEESEVNRSVSREHAHIEYDRHDGRVPAVQRPLVRARDGVRHVDRARRREPGSASRYAGHEAGAGRRNPPGPRDRDFHGVGTSSWELHDLPDDI